MSNISQMGLDREVMNVVEYVSDKAKAWLYHTHVLTIEPFTAKGMPYISFDIYIDGHDEGYIPVKFDEFANGEDVREKVLSGAIELILDYLYH